jgi:rhodanese-related sulfurtransferase
MARFFLKLRGFRNLQLLEGHMASWRRSGRGMQKG